MWEEPAPEEGRSQLAPIPEEAAADPPADVPSPAACLLFILGLEGAGSGVMGALPLGKHHMIIAPAERCSSLPQGHATVFRILTLQYLVFINASRKPDTFDVFPTLQQMLFGVFHPLVTMWHPHRGTNLENVCVGSGVRLSRVLDLLFGPGTERSSSQTATRPWTDPIVRQPAAALLHLYLAQLVSRCA